MQTNTIFRVFIAKIIHDKVNQICQMRYKKIAQPFDCVSAQERRDLAYYEFCSITDTVLARK